MISSAKLAVASEPTSEWDFARVFTLTSIACHKNQVRSADNVLQSPQETFLYVQSFPNGAASRGSKRP
jgi:hypothetical protein